MGWDRETSLANSRNKANAAAATTLPPPLKDHARLQAPLQRTREAVVHQDDIDALLAVYSGKDLLAGLEKRGISEPIGVGGRQTMIRMSCVDVIGKDGKPNGFRRIVRWLQPIDGGEPIREDDLDDFEQDLAVAVIKRDAIGFIPKKTHTAPGAFAQKMQEAAT